MSGARLSGKTVLITGGGSGIGRAACLKFAAEGANVAVADIDAGTGEQVANTILSMGGRAHFLPTDAGDADSVEATVNATISSFGRLDVLYNNVGGSSPNERPVTESTHDIFWEAIRLNLFSTWLFCHYGIPHIIRSGGGSVINTSSTMALTPPGGRSAYAASKGGVLSLTLSLAVEYAKHNVRVNALSPGFTASDRIKSQLHLLPPGYAAKLASQHPLGFGDPEHVAHLALFLASDESRHTSGQIFHVNNDMLGA